MCTQDPAPTTDYNRDTGTVSTNKLKVVSYDENTLVDDHGTTEVDRENPSQIDEDVVADIDYVNCKIVRISPPEEEFK